MPGKSVMPRPLLWGFDNRWGAAWQSPVAGGGTLPYMGRMASNRFPQGQGPSQRQLRVGELIRRNLSQALLHGEVHDDVLAEFSVTVGEVRMSPDLRVATAYVSPLGGKGSEELLKALRRKTGEIRHLISRGMTLKATPEMRFLLDETFDRLDQTRRMFADETVQRDIAKQEDTAPDAD
jgi:ribosome-binding factor A